MILNLNLREQKNTMFRKRRFYSNHIYFDKIEHVNKITIALQFYRIEIQW